MSWSEKLTLVTPANHRRPVGPVAVVLRDSWPLYSALFFTALALAAGLASPSGLDTAAALAAKLQATSPTSATVLPPVQIDREGVDRRTILSLVRHHRGAEDEASRQALADTIYEESVAADVDPLMVASIVARESSFRTRVVSRKGAVGLMQLRPFVARDLARRQEIAWEGTQTLHRPDVNLRLGITYYKELVERFDGDRHTALAAYNRGPTRVSRQLRTGAFSGSRYADRILDLYDELSVLRAAAVAEAEEPSSQT